ncbi:hypothetical protein FNJ88_06865 [Chryseobacterium sp. SNU WT5]|uniref:hypothetical protein n=1 Tax=Chryseobacterium sp. SNU WT5 TaxID=2594269 RepID=UPI00117C52E8|nr:hypothetical protein [Chryseobacterium sp. SNU WT5]QDP85299.1 hypothetical protein FNJ88_06865 [Chryseobacterium sp. SNU WT5]
MKDFDIEKLKRENVFTAKDDFFESMQARVLEQTTVPKHNEGKIFNLNWAYGAAAAVALIFGLTIFTDNANSEQEMVASNIESVVPKPIVSSSQAVEKSENEVNQDNTTGMALTSPQISHPKENKISSVQPTEQKVNYADNKKVNKSNPEVQVDQILASFTSAELTNVGKNTEQDIYLDLYY